MSNSPPQRFGEYEVERELGYGGFGTVYLARDSILERQVALKVLHAHLAARPDMVQRFLREAKAMAKLKHENIVTIHHLENDPLHPPYIVMEFIEGINLKKHLRSRKWRLPLQEAIYILRPVASALDAAHQQGMIHRDVKPANVLISEKGHIKLTDFGIVKMLQTDEATLTGLEDRLGTPKYMAPEQADEDPNAEIGPASDIYSLAVMSYQMLTGDLSSRGQEIRDALLTHLATPPPDPFKPNLPEGVVAELLKALDKEPTKRHATASSFVNALEQAAGIKNKPTNAPTSSLNLSIASGQVSTQMGYDQAQTSPRHIPPRQIPPRKIQSWPYWLPVAALLVVGLIVIGLFAYMISRGGGEADSESPAIVATTDPAREEATAREVAVAPTVTRISTGIPNPPTVTLIPTHTPNTPALVATRIAEDGMIEVYVPEGEFLMGAEDSDAADNEQPEHTVYLDAYWIDQTEITNQMYRACVDAGRCNTPSSTSRYDNPEYSNHPVVYVSWDDATTYCQWAGRRLPSEAEWEKAARGVLVLSPRRKEGSRKYPWGDEAPTAQLANFNGNVGDTTEVGSYPTGASPYGAYDMAGNVWEWVNDFYDEDYYADSPTDNPQGSSVEGPRVLRGGSWEDETRWLRGSARGKGVARFDDGGFRCAASEK